METILGRENMMAAYRRVVVNKGAPGIDKMTVDQLKPYLAERAHQGRPALRCVRDADRGIERCAADFSYGEAAGLSVKSADVSKRTA
ncbi:hypothetical protein GOA77_29535 [Sinorhizobium meliloti]|nr:hypothetical protein [Sinorhizobium meliloti]